MVSFLSECWLIKRIAPLTILVVSPRFCFLTPFEHFCFLTFFRKSQKKPKRSEYTRTQIMCQTEAKLPTRTCVSNALEKLCNDGGGNQTHDSILIVAALLPCCNSVKHKSICAVIICLIVFSLPHLCSHFLANSHLFMLIYLRRNNQF